MTLKKIILVFILLLLGALTGCVSNNYLSVSPHNSQRGESTDAITIENYTDLKANLIQQVDQHASQINMITYSYAGDVAQDVKQALNYIQTSYPLGAYAIKTIGYELAQVASYYQIQFTITYSRTAWELEQMEQIRMSNLEETIGKALDESSSKQVLMISAYRDTDFSAVCQAYADQHPEKVMQMPEVAYQVWPESGSVRIVELSYTYSYTRYELQQMHEQVDGILAAADSYIGYGRTDAETAELLYSFLGERFAYQAESTNTPAYSMLCQGVADSQTYAEIFRLLCQRAGLECYAVDGLKNGELYKWNILKIDELYYHADPFAAELSGLAQLPLYYDADMNAYVWDQAAYPACEFVEKTDGVTEE